MVDFLGNLMNGYCQNGDEGKVFAFICCVFLGNYVKFQGGVYMIYCNNVI